MRAASERLAAWTGPKKAPSRRPRPQNHVFDSTSSRPAPTAISAARPIAIVRRAPIQSSIQAKANAPMPGRHVECYAEDDHLVDLHAERAGGVDAAEGEQGRQPVGVDHVGEQEPRDRAVVLQRRAACGTGRRCPSAPPPTKRHALRRRLAHEQEQRHDEHRVPQRRERAGDAHVLRRTLVEPEERTVRLDEQDEDQRQADDAADIAQAPCPAGHAADIGGRRHARQQRVVEDGRDLEADRRHRDADQRQRDRLGRRRHEPQARRSWPR